MFCSTCGEELPPNTRSCPSCAARMGNPIAMPQSDNGPLIRAVLVTLCCCLPCGVVGIVYACKAEGCAKAGDWAGMAKMRQRSKTWTLVGFIGGLITQVLGVGLQVLVALLENS